jgi:hypothetical protein
VVPLIAVAIGFGIMMQGLLGLSMHAPLVGLLGAFEVPPALYIAAALRVASGIVLVMAAPASRLPLALRIVGWLLFAVGVLTPIVGVAFAESIRSWTIGGPGAVRAWAAGALILGAFIVYATFPKAPSPRTGPIGTTPLD